MGADAEGEGRSRCAATFKEHDFYCSNITPEEYKFSVDRFLPEGYTARCPGDRTTLTETEADELAIPTAHFENGLRLPLWPEVRQVLRYYGVLLSQLTPNAIADVVGFACYMREERIEFSLSVFRKVFSFRAYRDGTAYFASQHVTVLETVNKSHYWTQKFLLVKGPFGNLHYTPLARDENTYRPPGSLGGGDLKLFQYLAGKNFEVIFLRRHVDTLPPVPLGEGERDVPVHPPHAQGPLLSAGSLVTVAAAAYRELPSSGPTKKRKVGASSSGLGGSSKKAKGKALGTIVEDVVVLGESDESPPLAVKQENPPADQEDFPPNPEAASSSGPPLPKGHKNFLQGERVSDPLGEPLVAWDPANNRVSYSTLHPTWVELGKAGEEAFAMGFGIYGREDAAAFRSMGTRPLAYEAMRAQFRSAELAHMTSRRCLQTERDLRAYREELRNARDQIKKLEDKEELSASLLAGTQGKMDAETATALLARNKELELENKTLKAQVEELTRAVLPPSPGRTRPVRKTRESEDQRRRDAQEVADFVFTTLKEAELLAEDAMEFTAKDVVPNLFEVAPWLGERKDGEEPSE